MTIMQNDVEERTFRGPGRGTGMNIAQEPRSTLRPVGALRGWFQIGWTPEFPAGTAVPVTFFGQELVAYRDEAGDLVVFDAFCPHLGAHLGYGGRVDGDCIVCPFHGWKWDATGANVEIPYSTKVNRAKRLYRWEVIEQHGVVYLWRDPNGALPAWEPPRLIDDEAAFFPLFPGGTYAWEKVRVHPQLPLENAADAAHFKYVHMASQTGRVSRCEMEGPVFDVELELNMGRPGGKTWLTGEETILAHLGVRAFGVGLLTVCFRGVDGAVNLLSTTPIDEHHSRMMSSVWIPRGGAPAGADLPPHVERRLAEQVKQVDRDLPIWEHMAYIDHPPFPREEAHAFLALRRWSQQFYVADGDTEKE